MPYFDPIKYYNTHRALKARAAVLDFLISCCVASPMADEPDTWTEEESNGHYKTEDLKEAILDIKQFLESTKMNLT